MSNAITLPEPDGSAEANQRPHPGGGYEYDEVPAWSEPLVHAHAAAVTAAKDAEIAGLRAELDRLRQVQRSLSDKLIEAGREYLTRSKPKKAAQGGGK